MVLKEHMLLKSLTVSVSAEWSLVYCYMIYCVQDEIFTLWTIFITKWQGCDIDLTVIPIGSKAVAKTYWSGAWGQDCHHGRPISKCPIVTDITETNRNIKYPPIPLVTPLLLIRVSDVALHLRKCVFKIAMGWQQGLLAEISSNNIGTWVWTMYGIHIELHVWVTILIHALTRPALQLCHVSVNIYRMNELIYFYPCLKQSKIWSRLHAVFEKSW